MIRPLILGKLPHGCTVYIANFRFQLGLACGLKDFHVDTDGDAWCTVPLSHGSMLQVPAARNLKPWAPSPNQEAAGKSLVRDPYFQPTSAGTRIWISSAISQACNALLFPIAPRKERAKLSESYKIDRTQEVSRFGIGELRCTHPQTMPK